MVRSCRFYKYAVTVGCLAGYLLMSFAQACDKTMVLSYSGDWQPYMYQTQHANYSGEDFNLLQQVLTSMSCYLKVLPMTERRVSRERAKGMFDVSLGASFTEQRNQSYHFSVPYRQEKVGYVTSTASDMATDTLQQILAHGHVVAMNMDGFFGPEVAELVSLYPEQFVHMFDLPGRMQLLREGKVVAVIDDYYALCNMQQTEQSGDYILSKRILYTTDIHFMFNRETTSADWVAEFSEQLKLQLTTSQLATTNTAC